MITFFNSLKVFCDCFRQDTSCWTCQEKVDSVHQTRGPHLTSSKTALTKPSELVSHSFRNLCRPFNYKYKSLSSQKTTNGIWINRIWWCFLLMNNFFRESYHPGVGCMRQAFNFINCNLLDVSWLTVQELITISYKMWWKSVRYVLSICHLQSRPTWLTNRWPVILHTYCPTSGTQKCLNVLCPSFRTKTMTDLFKKKPIFTSPCLISRPRATQPAWLKIVVVEKQPVLQNFSRKFSIAPFNLMPMSQ